MGAVTGGQQAAGGDRDGRNVGSDTELAARGRRLRQGFLFASVVLIAAYPLLSGTGRHLAFLVVSIGAIPAVIVGLVRRSAGDRLPWWLLLAALSALNAGNLVGLFPGDLALVASNLLDALGNALILAAALALVVRRGRNDIDGIIDATIVALALGALLWEVVLLPHLNAAYRIGAEQVDFFVVMFALCGVLGALLRLVQTATKPVSALWYLIAALALGLIGYILLAVAPVTWLRVVAAMMFMGAYAAIGLFGLDPSTAWLAQANAVSRADALSIGRLAFLGTAVAVIPVSVGVRALLAEDVDGLLLAIGGATVAGLVMVRIGRLSSARARAEQALRHEAAHDHLTDLPNRREFIARLGEDLPLQPDSVILFCDLDEFKDINDTLGHGAGDQLLVEVARRLRASIRETDVVSRFGGDEFLVLFPSTSLAEARRIGERIANALSLPFLLRGRNVTIGASIGIAVANGEVDPEELIRRADNAMYEAKRYGVEASRVRIVAV